MQVADAKHTASGMSWKHNDLYAFLKSQDEDGGRL